MKLKEALKIVEQHQKWRLGKKEEMVNSPKELTEALNILIKECKKSITKK